MATPTPFSLGVVGAGQFSGQFSKLFQAHPFVSGVYVTDVGSNVFVGTR